jgi:hypothetical protein
MLLKSKKSNYSAQMAVESLIWAQVGFFFFLASGQTPCLQFGILILPPPWNSLEKSKNDFTVPWLFTCIQKTRKIKIIVSLCGCVRS